MDTITITEAVDQVREGIIPGVRGAGCATIRMSDGREFVLLDEHDDHLTEFRSAGDGVRRVREPIGDVTGDVEAVEWMCDETGGVIG